ncbi:MAG: winged helix-turn-helix transcriptional regulator, partial [Candidatus Andersenbacteria bacterium]|nr:winged helix-turn-helix transcriptional regulator [Candidatus Andersenbacteria bacterium]
MKSPLPKSAYRRNARIYRLMANPIRLEILNALAVQSLSVEQLTNLLHLRKANVSQHLAILRQTGLVLAERLGQSVIYAIVDSRIVTPCAILHRLRLTSRA